MKKIGLIASGIEATIPEELPISKNNSFFYIIYIGGSGILFTFFRTKKKGAV